MSRTAKADEPAESGQRLWYDAFDFVVVGHDALEAHGERKPHNPTEGVEIAPVPVYYNFLHGIELALKAYLVHRKVLTKDADLRSLGHDLDRALRKAIKHDLRTKCPLLTSAHTAAISGLSDMYKTREFNYSKTGPKTIGGIHPVVEAADILVACVYRFMHPTLPLYKRYIKFPWFAEAVRRTDNASGSA